MKLLLMIMAAESIAFGATVTVKLVEGESPSLLNLVSLERLFEPLGNLKPDVATGATRVFKGVEPGSYSVVVWEAAPVWRPSPLFDQTIIVEAADVEVYVRKAKPAQDLRLTLPPNMYAEVKRLYKGFAFVPCRLQRLHGLNAPTYGYRWLALNSAGKKEVSSPVEISSGDYIVTIPFPVAAEAWPPPRVLRQHLPQPLVAFRFTVTDDLTANVEIFGMHLVVMPHTSSNAPQSTER